MILLRNFFVYALIVAVWLSAVHVNLGRTTKSTSNDDYVSAHLAEYWCYSCNDRSVCVFREILSSRWSTLQKCILVSFAAPLLIWRIQWPAGKTPHHLARVCLLWAIWDLTGPEFGCTSTWQPQLSMLVSFSDCRGSSAPISCSQGERATGYGVVLLLGLFSHWSHSPLLRSLPKIAEFSDQLQREMSTSDTSPPLSVDAGINVPVGTV